MNKRIISILTCIFVAINMLCITTVVNAEEKNDTIEEPAKCNEALQKPKVYTEVIDDAEIEGLTNSKTLIKNHTYEFLAESDSVLDITTENTKYDFVFYNNNNEIVEYKKSDGRKLKFNIYKGYKLVISAVGGNIDISGDVNNTTIKECNKIEFVNYTVNPCESIVVNNSFSTDFDVESTFEGVPPYINYTFISGITDYNNGGFDSPLYLYDVLDCVNEFGGKLIVTLPKTDKITAKVESNLVYTLKKDKTYEISLAEGTESSDAIFQMVDNKKLSYVYESDGKYDELNDKSSISRLTLYSSKILKITNYSDEDLKMYVKPKLKDKIKFQEINDKLEVTNITLENGKCYEICNTGYDYAFLYRVPGLLDNISRVDYDANGNIKEYFDEGTLSRSMELYKGEKIIISLENNDKPAIYTTLLKMKNNLRITEVSLDKCLKYTKLDSNKTFKLTNNSDKEIKITANPTSNATNQLAMGYIIKDEKGKITSFLKTYNGCIMDINIPAKSSVSFDFITGLYCDIAMPNDYSKFVDTKIVDLEDNFSTVPVYSGRKYHVKYKGNDYIDPIIISRSDKATYNETEYNYSRGSKYSSDRNFLSSYRYNDIRISYCWNFSVIENTSIDYEEIVVPKEIQDIYSIKEDSNIILTETTIKGSFDNKEPLTFHMNSLHKSGVKYRFVVKNDANKVVYDSDYKLADTMKWTPTYEGDYDIYFFAKDVNSNEVDSNIHSIRIRKIDLELLQMQNISSEQYVNVPINFEADDKGGNGKISYKFELYDYNTGKTEIISDYSYNNKCTFTPSKAGKYRITYYASDVKGEKDYVTTTFNVSERELLVNFSKLSPQYLGQEVKITSKLPGEGITYRYVFYKDNVFIGATTYDAKDYYIFRPKSEGKYTIKVMAKDKNNNIITKKDSYIIRKTFKINDIAYDKSIPLKLGNKITFNILAEGEMCTYRYIAYYNGKFMTSSEYSEKTKYSWIPTKTGTYHIQFKVKDKYGSVAIKTLKLTIN